VGSLVLWLQTEVDRLTRVVRGLGSDVSDGITTALAEVVTEVWALADLSGRQQIAGAETIGKIAYADLNIRVHQLAMDVSCAHPGAVPDAWAHRWSDSYLYTRAYTISGGSNEILRNVVAKRGLRLGS